MNSENAARDVTCPACGNVIGQAVPGDLDATYELMINHACVPGRQMVRELRQRWGRPT